MCILLYAPPIVNILSFSSLQKIWDIFASTADINNLNKLRDLYRSGLSDFSKSTINSLVRIQFQVRILKILVLKIPKLKILSAFF